MKSVILASASPRRKELMEHLSIPFSIQVSKVEEIVPHGVEPEKVVASLAFQKAEDVFKHHEESIVIGADTIVVCNGKILGKPKDKEDAFSMLSQLSNQTHQVMTGVAILSNSIIRTFTVITDVTFYALLKEEVYQYIETGEPMDKAGSYGIQGKGSLFVKEIKGDYFSVVGLPVSQLHRELMHFYKRKDEMYE